jgi:predicted unusual protein kinase regulating ubiquinone biosynthesis (AarF/ABC1/UbiB family)
MHQFAHQFRDLMFSMPFQVPHNLLLLGRTVAILSGMCTGLDPDFNLWEQLAPYARKLVAEEAGSNWRVWLDELGELAKVLLTLPSQADRVLTRMERGEIHVQVPQLSRQLSYLEQAVYRLLGGLLFATLLLAGVVLITAGDILLGEGLVAISLLALLWTVFLARGHPPNR